MLSEVIVGSTGEIEAITTNDVSQGIGTLQIDKCIQGLHKVNHELTIPHSPEVIEKMNCTLIELA